MRWAGALAVKRVLASGIRGVGGLWSYFSGRSGFTGVEAPTIEQGAYAQRRAARSHER